MGSRWRASDSALVDMNGYVCVRGVWRAYVMQVLLFYPDGKRSSAELAQHAHQAQLVQQAAGAFQGHDLMMMDHNNGIPEQNQPNNAAAANLLLEQRRLHRERSALNEEVRPTAKSQMCAYMLSERICCIVCCFNR